jgi:histidinol-phosphate aminotransferase
MRAAAGEQLRKYSDPSNAALKDTLAAPLRPAPRAGLRRQQLGRSAGAYLPCAAQARPAAAAPDISYSFYPTYCSLYGIECASAAQRAFEIDIADYRQPCGAIIIANPNAPTGIALPLGRSKRCCRRTPIRWW